jgi:large subunit ribosomal protein L2
MLKVIKTITSGYINQSFEDRSCLSKDRPTRSLVRKKKKILGRDDTGQISTRHKGGGAKRLYRLISTLESIGEQAKVIAIEYDPNRTARIALVELENGQRKYVIAPENLKAGDQIKSRKDMDLLNGDRLKLEDIPVGSQICDIQMYPMAKKFIARAAGASASIMALEGDYALLKLPSGELRKIRKECFATIGQISNSEHSNIRIGKAGRNRMKNIRPSVRGQVMSPDAHPHGGGEGNNPIGLKYPKTPWGKIAIGKKTRGKKKSDKFIVKRAGQR